MRTVELDFDIGETVFINTIGMLGRVDSCSIDSNGLMYRVVYWNDRNRVSTWMYDWELAKRDPTSKAQP